jgi:hypothetical protein
MVLNRLFWIYLVAWTLFFSQTLQAKTGPKFLFPLKSSTSLLVSTSSRPLVADWLEKSYFKNNDWGLKGLSVSRKSSKKNDEFKIFYNANMAEGKPVNQAMTMKLCQKKKLVFIQLKMEKKFIQYLLKDPYYSNMSKDELKIEFRKYLKDKLDDIKSYW